MIRSNTYDNQNTSDTYVQNVYDATDGVTYTWINTVGGNYDQGAQHDLQILDECCGDVQVSKQMVKKFKYMRVVETEGIGSAVDTGTSTWTDTAYGMMRLAGVLSSEMGVTALAANNEAGGSYYYQAEVYQPGGATPSDGLASFNSNGDSNGRSLNYQFLAKL